MEAGATWSPLMPPSDSESTATNSSHIARSPWTHTSSGQAAVLYVPVLNGVRLPSGEIHDGFMFAHDEGQGITGKRVDVFVGYESDVDNTLTRSGPDRGHALSRFVYEVDAETANQLNQKYKEQFVR